MIINKLGLLKLAPIKNMVRTKQTTHGTSWGLTECGYDIRIKQDVWMFWGRRFVLASSVEEFNMPTTVMGRVLNKSTWARRGIDASMTTNIEPGWKGFLTIELRYSGFWPRKIKAGSGIAQVIFEKIAEEACYDGKYQNQGNRPVRAKESV
jgi:dCTP deaminase